MTNQHVFSNWCYLVGGCGAVVAVVDGSCNSGGGLLLFPFKYNYILIKYAHNTFLPANYWREEAELAFHTTNHY